MNEIRAKIVGYEDGFEKIRVIRSAVFIEEQGVSENLEIDGLDSEAKHALAFVDGRAVGTGRMFLDGHIGRVSVIKQYRGRGIGKLIIETLIEEAQNLLFPKVWLSSQYHAKIFYEKLGFVEFGEIYEEVQIDHIKMKKELRIQPLPNKNPSPL